MPKLNMSVPHQLSKEEAMTRIRTIFQKLKSEHAGRIDDLQEQWTDDGGTFKFSAMGFPVSGSLAVTPADIKISGDLPFAATFFKSRIESTIRDRASELLA